MKLLTGIVLAISIFFGVRDASAMRCVLTGPPGNTCYSYRPDYPPGGRDCTGAPGIGEININTNSDGSGWCVTLPAHLGSWVLNSTNGWYGYYYVKQIVVGPGVSTDAHPCGHLGCPGLLAGYTYSYTNPPYGAGEPGWNYFFNP